MKGKGYQLHLALSDDAVGARTVPTDGSFLGNVLRQARLTEYEPCADLWVIEESSSRLAYLTHGIFRFFGKFPPPIASRLLHDYTRPGDLVVDTMVGSGTTLLEALTADRDAIGVDVNPLACLVSKAKVTAVDSSGALTQLEALSSEWNSLVNDAATVQYIPELRHRDHWFFPETAVELAAIRRFIEERLANCGDAAITNLFKVGLASIIRRVSRASPGMGRIFFDPYYEREDVGSTFREKMLSLLADLEDLRAFLEATRPRSRIDVYQGDARRLPLSCGGARLVICHPPYFNVYRYTSVYRFEMLWLGFQYRATQRAEIREAFKLGKPEKVKDYVTDMLAVLRELKRISAPRGRCALMIGDTAIRGERICTTALVLPHAERMGLHVERLFIRVPKLTEASYKTALRRKTADLGAKISDFVVVFRNGPGNPA